MLIFCWFLLMSYCAWSWKKQNPSLFSSIGYSSTSRAFWSCWLHGVAAVLLFFWSSPPRADVAFVVFLVLLVLSFVVSGGEVVSVLRP